MINIKEIVEEKIKTDIRNGDETIEDKNQEYLHDAWCETCGAYFNESHDCDNCSFCGTDR
jgi:hypothetical protein